MNPFVNGALIVLSMNAGAKARDDLAISGSKQTIFGTAQNVVHEIELLVNGSLFS